MTENNDRHLASAEETKKRHWMSAALWADKEDIRESAEHYQEVKWYKSVRFWPAALIFVMTWLAGGLSGNYLDAIGASVIICPLWYLNIKGYRWSMLLFAVIYTVDKAYTFYMNAGSAQAGSPVVALIWWIIIVGALMTAFRIENYRVKHGLSKPKRYLKDTLISLGIPVSIFVLFSVYTLFVTSPLTEEQQENIAFSRGVIERNTTLISNYCQMHGVPLSNFPQQFRKSYSDEIAVVEEWLDQDEIFKMNVETYIEQNKAKTAEIFDPERQQWIIMKMAVENGVKIDDFVWKDKYDQILPPDAYCRMMDENFENLKSQGYFDGFAEVVKSLKIQQHN